jgi:hypothetical protein
MARRRSAESVNSTASHFNELRVSIDGQNVTGEHRPETEEREPVEEFPLLASPSGNTGPPRLFPTGNDQAFNIKNKSMNVMVNDTVILDNSNDQDFNNNDNNNIMNVMVNDTVILDSSTNKPGNSIMNDMGINNVTPLVPYEETNNTSPIPVRHQQSKFAHVQKIDLDEQLRVANMESLLYNSQLMQMTRPNANTQPPGKDYIHRNG